MSERREFIKTAGLGLAAAGIGGLAATSGSTLAAAASAGAPSLVPGFGLNRQGDKEVIRGRKAVASSQSPIVTQTMLDRLPGNGTNTHGPLVVWNSVDAPLCGRLCVMFKVSAA